MKQMTFQECSRIINEGPLGKALNAYAKKIKVPIKGRGNTVGRWLEADRIKTLKSTKGLAAAKKYRDAMVSRVKNAAK